MPMDLNGTFYDNIDNQPSFKDMRLVDLNGTVQQPGDLLSNNGSSELHVEGFSNFYGISNDDMEKIQVLSNLQ